MTRVTYEAMVRYVDGRFDAVLREVRKLSQWHDRHDRDHREALADSIRGSRAARLAFLALGVSADGSVAAFVTAVVALVHR